MVLKHRFAIFVILIILAWTMAGVAPVLATDEGKNEIPENSSTQECDVYEFDDEFDDEFEEISQMKVFDPLSGYNRFMTHVNDKMYFWVFKPLARGFSAVIPEPGRRGLNRFFRNLRFPIRLVNNLVQLKIKRAGIEIARFGVNTTVGILGFGDPAKNWLNLDTYEEDFGQTLGHYGLGSGFHLVLPLLGPSNLRDSLGLIPDYFLNPVSYLDNTAAEIGIKTVDGVNDISLHIGEYESLKKDMFDSYSFMRDVYEQDRKTMIAE